MCCLFIANSALFVGNMTWLSCKDVSEKLQLINKIKILTIVVEDTTKISLNHNTTITKIPCR